MNSLDTERERLKSATHYLELVAVNKHTTIPERIVFYLSVAMGFVLRLLPVEFKKIADDKVRNHAYHWWRFIHIYNVWIYHVLARVILPKVQIDPHRLNSYLGKTNPVKMQ